MKFFRPVLLLLAIPTMLVYAGTPKPERLSADSLFLLGHQAFEQAKFRLAAKYFDYLILNYPVFPDVPDAQFYLAESYFNLRRYNEASVEYEFLYKQFPQSPHVEEARIKAAECTFKISEPFYREQKITFAAQRMAMDFLDTYPESEFAPRARDLLAQVDEKLARKELTAAKLYFKFDEYEAAVMSLEYILEHYPLATKTNAETRYYLGTSKASLGEIDEAEDILGALLEHPVWGEKAQKVLERLARQKG